MHKLYHLRHQSARNFAAIADSSDFEEDEATYTNSEAPRTSPAASISGDEPDTFQSILEEYQLDTEDEAQDPDFTLPKTRAPRKSDEEKTRTTLRFMRDNFHKFSLRRFLEVLFSSDDAEIHAFAVPFLEGGGGPMLLDLWWERARKKRNHWGGPFIEQIVEKTAEECERECSQLTDRASAGPFKDEASRLRIPIKEITVPHIRDFRYSDMLESYEMTMPSLQRILIAAIGKSGQPPSPSSRNPDHGRVAVVSMILNLRSRLTNYHAIINGFLLWQSGTPKRIIQVLNRLGFCISYEAQGRAIGALAKDANRRSRLAAQDRRNVKALAYDNFNWRHRAWETSALHTHIQHDQVSAILVILNVDPAITTQPAHRIMSVSRFDERFGGRHRIPKGEALERISPTSDDLEEFRRSAILHMKEILVHDTKAFSRFRNNLSSFQDPRAIPPHVTQRHYLPTFDQEQASTRGNMVVLTHYLLDVLGMPKKMFEEDVVVVLGDRLTTARDRAAQDQRAVDRSSDRADHLSSIVLSSGMMHQCLNMIMNVVRVMFGSTATHDRVSLSTLRDKLPNCEGLDSKKIDFYAWLRFLDVVLRSLVIASAHAHLDTKSLPQLIEATKAFKLHDFNALCEALVDGFLLPSISTLEYTGVKTLPGETECGHAVILMHALMTMREMRHAIKHGHPTRMLRVLKFWAPMFYGGGSYNYSNECMELLHNILGDWPEDSAAVILAGMLVNTSGRENGFKEGDLDVEHLNKLIKSRAHGVNATPALLERITPALGQVRHLTEQISEDLGLEELNQYHTSVRQDKDVEILVSYLLEVGAFRFQEDKLSKHSMVHLFYDGQHKLTGPSGGHARHLVRHKLRMRTRHDLNILSNLTSIDLLAIQELTDAVDSNETEFDLIDNNNSDDGPLQFPSLEELGSS